MSPDSACPVCSLISSAPHALWNHMLLPENQNPGTKTPEEMKPGNETPENQNPGTKTPEEMKPGNDTPGNRNPGKPKPLATGAPDNRTVPYLFCKDTIPALNLQFFLR